MWQTKAVLSLKRERERLLLAPADPAKAKARDKRLDEIDESIRKKEAELRLLLPALKRSEELAKRTPADLRKRFRLTWYSSTCYAIDDLIRIPR